MAITAEIALLIFLALLNFFIAIMLTFLILFVIARIGTIPAPAPAPAPARAEPIAQQRGFRRRLHF